MVAATTQKPSEVTREQDQRVILHDVSWSQYEALHAICGDNAGVRLTYLNGELDKLASFLEGPDQTACRARVPGLAPRGLMPQAAIRSRPARDDGVAARIGRTHMAMRQSKKQSKKAVKKKSVKKAKPAPVPAGFHTVTPHLVVRDGAAAIEFYKKAFGAREKLRMAGPGGSVAHAELRIGDSLVMLGDEMPEMGSSAPQTVGGSPVHIFLYVKDVDQWFARATAAGATGDMPPTDMFWGDRYCKLTDPLGHKWAMATHIEDLTPKQMARRGAEAMAGPPQG